MKGIEKYIKKCHEKFSDRIEALCDVIVPYPEIKNLTQDVGAFFGTTWRIGECEDFEDFVKCVKSHLESIKEKCKNGRGVLNTDLEVLNEIVNLLKYSFLVGTEDEHETLEEMISCSSSREEALLIAEEMALKTPPPTIPVFDTEMFGNILCKLIVLLVARDIGNEAINGGSEGDDAKERESFQNLRDVLFSISDAHKCTCENDPCTCSRGGGFSASTISILATEYMSESDTSNQAPIHTSTVNEDFFGVDDESNLDWETSNSTDED